MYICEECHAKRQERPAQESQSLQFTGATWRTRSTCSECGNHYIRETFYEYLTAFALLAELNDVRERLERYTDNAPVFPLSDYDSAADMAGRINHFPDVLAEAMRQIIHYAAELEESHE